MMMKMFSFLFLVAFVRASPINYPSNAGVNDVFIYGGSYTSGSVYAGNLDTVCSFLYERTPLNGIELHVNFGNGTDEVWGLSQCSNPSLREHCSDCLTAARVHVDNYNASYPLRGGGYWTNGTNYNCFLLYDNNPITITRPDVVINMTVTSNTTSSSSEDNEGNVSKKTYTNIFVYVEAGAIALCILAIILILLACSKTSLRAPPYHKLEGKVEGAVSFEYESLKSATGSFSAENKLGQGGFGIVYKGTLEDGVEVAVKKLSSQSKQGDQEFINEINIITGVQHRNLVRLRGYSNCVKNERLLVYEYLENKSLDVHLFDENSSVFLNWPSRYNIVLGIARGLSYLHQDSQVQIVHRDIKASNILLDKNLNPKISDFGLSKLFEADESFISGTRVAGTFGYMAPECLTGRLTVKADVYSFGVLVLEIVSGRKCITPEFALLDVTWELYENERLVELVDTRLNGEYSKDEVLQVIQIALLCTNQEAKSRPLMSEVVAMLLGYMEVRPVEPRSSSTVIDLSSSYLEST